MADSVTGSAADEPNRQADGVEDVIIRNEEVEESTDVDVGKSTLGIKSPMLYLQQSKLDRLMMLEVPHNKRQQALTMMIERVFEHN